MTCSSPANRLTNCLINYFSIITFTAHALRVEHLEHFRVQISIHIYYQCNVLGVDM